MMYLYGILQQGNHSDQIKQNNYRQISYKNCAK